MKTDEILGELITQHKNIDFKTEIDGIEYEVLKIDNYHPLNPPKKNLKYRKLKGEDKFVYYEQNNRKVKGVTIEIFFSVNDFNIVNDWINQHGYLYYLPAKKKFQFFAAKIIRNEIKMMKNFKNATNNILDIRYKFLNFKKYIKKESI